MYSPLTYQIALTLLEGVGAITAKTLVSYCGGIENVFDASKKVLLKIPGIGPKTAGNLLKREAAFERALKEQEFIKKYKITPIFYLDKSYPKRLKECIDSPILLYYRGTAALNQTRIISVVGTRRATDYGRTLCERLAESLKPYNVLVISGLAYGIDHAMHKACVKNKLETVGVLAHGLDRIYPTQHSSLAKEMLQHGGLLTEFKSETETETGNFPSRNRIVAGLADATIVVESPKKGGSMITAKLALDYHREVFAFPGRVGDTYSKGCNHLIRSNMAGLIESGEELTYALGWEATTAESTPKQQILFAELTPIEQAIVSILESKEIAHIDWICKETQLNNSTVAANLLNLEFKGLLKAMPGSQFKLVR